ncbi:4'-phosphopantetheinyl transferase superfamily protein [Streptomyces sp. NPDC020719]|uniref:4'-phosphopantetheinyl transferase superfamily protein n=1 Tax=unclassified Streptomyces TaxID=2593676 RepID=UPI0033F60531
MPEPGAAHRFDARPEDASGRASARRALLMLEPVLREQGLRLGLAYAQDASAYPAGPGEWELAAAMGPVRRRDFLAGRQAARRALAETGGPEEEILRDGRRPRFPVGRVGSISHSGGLAVALAAPAARFDAVGCDLELRELPLNTAHIVLGPDERTWPDGTPDASAVRRLLAAFSAKEAAFKAFGALLPQSQAPATLLAIGTRPVPGGFLAWPKRLPGQVLDVQVRPAGPGVFSWAAAPVVRRPNGPATPER